jgi:protoheme IX farnesyltransferase
MHTTTPAPAGRSMGQMARDVVSLFKLRIGVLIMITALVGMAVAPGPRPASCRCWCWPSPC